jgi:hypothetical protein
VRSFVKVLVGLGPLILLVNVAMGQSMIEHAAAAAGGSIGGVAGKQVSNGIDSIFGKLAKQTDKAAATAPSGQRPSAVGGPALTGPARTPSRTGQASRKTPLPRPGNPAPSSTPPTVAQAAPVPEPPPLTKDQLAEVTTGASRQDVVAKLGTPFARIFIPEEGGMSEIYQYSSRGKLIGSLRLTNGVVSNVRVDAQ